MKKQLLCTSAIALGIAAAPAMSQEWDVNVGGYYNSHIGLSSVDGDALDAGGTFAGADFDGVEIAQDAEIIVNPTITLDNGMTFGATVQYETGSSGRYTDEVYITVSSDTFGTLDIGSENSAGYKMMWSAGTPSVGGVPINSGSMSLFVPFITSGSTVINSFVGAGISQATEVGSITSGDGNSDIQRISYYTPDFNGFQLGVSYAPDAAGTDGANVLSDKNAVQLKDIFDLGVTYNQTFGTTDVALAARYGTGDSNVPGRDDPETYGVAATFGFGAFAVGAHYAENDNGFAGGVLDESGYGAGVTYDLAGPWSVGLEYFYGEGDAGAAGEDEVQFIKAAASRNFGPGVDWTLALVQSDIDAVGTANDVDALSLVSTVSLSF